MVVIISSIIFIAVLCSEDEERLVRDLFRDYNKLIRPVEVMNDTVDVEFKLSFIQLINVVSVDVNHLCHFQLSILVKIARNGLQCPLGKSV